MTTLAVNRRRLGGWLSVAAVPLAMGRLAAPAAAASARDRSGAVYTMTNDPNENAIAIFHRGMDGALSAADTVPTGGKGTGAGLGSQGSVTLSDDRRWLLVANAGSDTISVFRVRAGGLELTDLAESGGTRPISVAIHDDWVYVLHSGQPMGAPARIQGFTLSAKGRLAMLSDSQRPLSADAPDPAQVSFSPAGNVLAVTEKATNRISIFTVGEHGRPGDLMAQMSSGMTPFGFAFDPLGHARPPAAMDMAGDMAGAARMARPLSRLVVSEAFGGMADASAASSYQIDGRGELKVLDGSVPTTETAACWVAITPAGRYAYTTNAGSGTVTGFRVEYDGHLTRLDDDGVTAGEAGRRPIDAAIDRLGRNFYVLNAGTHTIGAYTIAASGSLTPVPGADLPATAAGLAVS
jgi:6-phosphogluconolactonase (cycloisomerase 2 family)